MKNIFIVNYSAGPGTIQKELENKLNDYSKDHNISLYATKGILDATNYVKEYLKNNPNEEVRFIACGGDGTINEVFNGVIGYDNAYVSFYPCGSGNDFVKAFDNQEAFYDLDRIINSDKFMNIDILKSSKQYSINVINFGFDTTVAKMVNDDRLKTGHGNKLSYIKGIIKAFITSMKTDAKIYADDELLNPEGQIILASFANGKYYGGSFKCAPYAKLDDGLIEVCVVKPISRLRLLTMIKSYIDGKHIDDPKLQDVVIYRRCKKIIIKSDQEIAYTLDGEITKAKEFNIEIIPNILKLSLPKDY